ncbi:MAG TPA: ABC transporter permease [Vicinamibacteria bacterium]|nr:ABC transporter permease [Vicinamibacteria bacterium]
MLTRLWRRVRELWRGDLLDREAQEELAHHLELFVAEKVRAGLDAAEARRLARLELGHPEEARELLRESRTGSRLDTLAKDVSLAVRALSRQPAFSAAAVLTVALGVGASTALFAVMDAAILKPLPLPSPEGLVRIYDTNLARNVERTGVATGNLADWRRRVKGLRGIAGHYTLGRTLTLGSDSEVVLTAQVTEDFFPLLGVGAALGRTFSPEETRASVFNSAAAPVGPDPVVVLSHSLWRSRFGGDPGVVGRTIVLERRPARVVGVMPGSFALPGPEVQVFIPWGFTGEEPRDQHYVSALARLAPVTTLPQAEEELRVVAEDLGREHPQTNGGWSVRLVSLRDDLAGDAGRSLLVLLGAVALVLLAASANVALLALARGLERAHEASVRLALGATRPRLLCQFLMEPLLVSLAGGALGALLAFAFIVLARRLAADLPRIHEAALDPRSLLFAGAATVLAALVSGLPAAWRRAHPQPAIDLAGTPARVAGRGPRHAFRDALVVAEVAMAVVLLAGASLLVRSYHRLRAVDPGFDPRGVLVAPVFLDMETYGSGGKSRAYYATLVERLSALPGVVSVGAATALPASPLGPDFQRPVWPEETPRHEQARRPAWVRMVTTGYFRTLGMEVVEGRAFDDRDGPQAPRAVVLSRGLARRLWPDGGAVGRRLVVDYSTAGTYPYDVVGVVDDVRFGGPRAEPRHEIYLPHAQRPYLVMNVAVKASGDPRYLASAVRDVLRDLDPGKPPQGLHALSDLLGATYARDRQAMIVVSTFAVVAVLLSLLGIHGVLSHRVRERTREIGIRMAIGADQGHLLWWIAGRGLRLVAIGLVLGSATAVASCRLLSGLLFGVSPMDPAVPMAVAALPLVALFVSLHPAWRATRIDAADVLRAG